MKNLKGVQNCDDHISEELTKAGIQKVPTERNNIEVIPYSIKGQLSYFEFTRAWSYWVVKGKMPLKVAIEMYETEIGKKDIRVAGHCGCPHPENWAFPYFFPILNFFSSSTIKRIKSIFRNTS